MNKFDLDRSCVKCGYRRANAKYETQMIPLLGTETIFNPPTKYIFNEYLLRTCSCCGYQWKEHTNDAEAA